MASLFGASICSEADVDAVFPNLDCLTSQTTGCNSIQDGKKTTQMFFIVFLKSWESCCEKMGQKNTVNKMIEGSHSDEHVCRVHCPCSHKQWKWEAFSIGGLVYRFETLNWTSCPRSFPNVPSLKDPERMKASA